MKNCILDIFWYITSFDIWNVLAQNLVGKKSGGPGPPSPSPATGLQTYHVWTVQNCYLFYKKMVLELKTLWIFLKHYKFGEMLNIRSGDWQNI